MKFLQKKQVFKASIFKRKYFTLMELLIVMSVIAILASMLLPALKTARDTASRIVCMGKIKQFATPWQAYQNDYNGFLPQQTGTTTPRDNWICKIMPELFTEEQLNRSGSNDIKIKGPLAEGKQYKSLWCSEHPFRSGDLASTAGIAGMSYAINDYGIGGSTYGTLGTYRLSPVPYRKYTQIVSWSRQVAFAEARSYTMPMKVLRGGYPGLDASGGFLHNGNMRANVLYCDGHAVSVSRRDTMSVAESLFTFSNPEQ